MSVLIKGMEMPKSGMVLDVRVYSDGLVTAWDKKVGWIHYHAIPVPPHGRLIDADALDDDGPDVCNSFMRDGYVESCEWGYSHEQIKNAPTIIPAEEGE